MTDVYQVTRGSVYAGFDVHDGRVIRAAPILKRMILGKSLTEAKRVLQKAGYHVNFIEIANE